MSNYTKSTNFTAKDSLPTGDTNKVIRGSEFDTEFDAIQTAVGTKSDLAGPTFTGTATFDGITATGTVNFTGGSVTTNIDGGTIDGVTIGGATPGAGTFSSLTATTADINAGTVDNTVIGGSTPAAGTFSSLTATTADINGGNIDGTVIGASSTAAISGTTGTFSGAVTGSNLNVSNWDTAFSWGNHGTQGYLTSVTFSDIDAGAVTLSSETFVDSDTQIPTNAAVIDYVAATIPLITEVNDLTVSVTWANVPDANITESSVTQHQAALSINTSQISGGLSLTDITDVTATASEVNVLDGITATTAELNYTDGVTSNIQTQLDSKVGASYTGDVDITGELLVDSYNETFKKVSSVSAISFDFSFASYDSKSFSTASQESTPRGIAFKSDGTKMYVTGNVSDTVYQYSLSTAWDVSTASYDSVSLSVTSEDGIPADLLFSSDGTKMYVVGEQNTSVFQYTLSTAWDLSTASYDSISFSTASQANNPEAIALKSDGTVMFIANGSSKIVYQYTLSTAWDVSSASYASKSFNAASQETSSVTGMDVNSDGTKMCIVGYGADTIFEYDLSTAWDVSTASYNSVSLNISAQETAAYALRIGNDEKVYLAGNANDTVYQYTASTTTYSTTFDCENANVFETELDANTTVAFSNPPASGTPVVSASETLSDWSYDSSSFSVASQATSPAELVFNNDGTKLYICCNATNAVYEYNLSTAYDLSTASYNSVSLSISSQDGSAQGIHFKSDGTKMYILGFNNKSIFQYSLSTAFDLSTASYDSVSFSVNSQQTAPTGLTFKSDGTKLYVVGETGTAAYQYSLSTAWDISTASYDSVSLTVSQDSFPKDIEFNSDGTKLYMVGANTNTLYEYTLGTAYSLSGGSYTSNSFSVASQDSNIQGLTFKTDYTKLYIVGSGNDAVYQYSTSSSSLNDSTAYAMSLKVVQDSGASGYTVTWPTSVDWPAATAPTLTATASAVDQFVFYTYDGGTNWYGFTAGQALG